MSMDAESFDRIAREVFAPAYPLIARQIRERTGINEGVCVDVGCGGGYLGLALAQITRLQVYLLDISPEMVKISQENLKAWNLASRVKAIQGDVHALPFPDSSINLVVSRGSMFFWEDLARAYGEIHRVLVPGGMAYIGGGFGSRELKEKIWQEMIRRNPDWPCCVKKRWERLEEFREKLGEAGIRDYEILQEEAGLWILIKKR